MAMTSTLTRKLRETLRAAVTAALLVAFAGTAIADEGTRLVVVPDLKGMSLEAAAATLNASGLALGLVTREANVAEVDTVARQGPKAGSEVRPNAEVAVALSLGIKLPSVEWRPANEAEPMLRSLGLTDIRTHRVHSCANAGFVDRQLPTGDSVVDEKTIISLIISTGTPPAPLCTGACCYDVCNQQWSCQYPN